MPSPNAQPQMPEPEALKSTKEFHDTFKCPVLSTPTIPDKDRCALRVSLLQEEVQELADAIAANDLTEVADALADIQYVLSGAVHEFGMGKCFKSLFTEVHRSNMSKQCDTLEDAQNTVKHYADTKGTEGYIKEQPNGKYIVYRKADNKTLKSVSYSAASLAPILRAAEKEDA